MLIDFVLCLYLLVIWLAGLIFYLEYDAPIAARTFLWRDLRQSDRRVVATLAVLLFVLCAMCWFPRHARAQSVDNGQTMHEVNPQQAPVGDVPISVPANTSTLIWTRSVLTKVLRIVPQNNNATCLIQCDASAAATANSTPIPSGYVFNYAEPPPSYSCYAYCGSAAVIVVSDGR